VTEPCSPWKGTKDLKEWLVLHAGSLKAQAEQYLSHNAGSAGARALTAFCDQENDRTLRQQLKRREAALYQSAGPAPQPAARQPQRVGKSGPAVPRSEGTFQQRLLGRLQSEALQRSGSARQAKGESGSGPCGRGNAAGFGDAILRERQFGAVRAAAVAATICSGIGSIEEVSVKGVCSTAPQGSGAKQKGVVDAQFPSITCHEAQEAQLPVLENEAAVRKLAATCTVEQAQSAVFKPAAACTEKHVQAAAAHADISRHDSSPEGLPPRRPTALKQTRSAGPADVARRNADQRMLPCNHADKVVTGRPIMKKSVSSRPSRSLDMSTTRRVHKLVHSIQGGAAKLAVSDGQHGCQKDSREEDTHMVHDKLARSSAAPSALVQAACEIPCAQAGEVHKLLKACPSEPCAAGVGCSKQLACSKARCSDASEFAESESAEKENALQCNRSDDSFSAGAHRKAAAEGNTLKRRRPSTSCDAVLGTSDLCYGSEANAGPTTARQRAKAAMMAGQKRSPCRILTGAQSRGSAELHTRHMVNPLQAALQKFPQVPAPGRQIAKAAVADRVAMQARPKSLGAYAYDDTEWGVRADGRSFVGTQKVPQPDDSTKVHQKAPQSATPGDEWTPHSGSGQMTEFERAFGRQEGSGDCVKDRLLSLAEDAEWTSFREKVEHLGELVCPACAALLFMH
jgi:hypothetical protein